MEQSNDIGRTVRIALGAGHVTLGLGLAIVLLAALGARYLAVDVPIGLVAVLLTASGGALLVGVRQDVLLARIAAAVTLVTGLAFLTALIWTASYLKGIYGDLGRGASAFFALISFTVLPYLVLYPGVALALLRPKTADAAKKPADKPADKPAQDKQPAGKEPESRRGE
jgi:hypothetical protein